MYRRVIDWTDQMETRRVYESKLLRRASETLMVSSPEEKNNRRDTVWRIAHGMVVLNLPDELAWTICVDWRDFEVVGKPNTNGVNNLTTQNSMARCFWRISSVLCPKVVSQKSYPRTWHRNYLAFPQTKESPVKVTTSKPPKTQ
jgi:hypothetical protein